MVSSKATTPSTLRNATMPRESEQRSNRRCAPAWQKREWHQGVRSTQWGARVAKKTRRRALGRRRWPTPRTHSGLARSMEGPARPRRRPRARRSKSKRRFTCMAVYARPHSPPDWRHAKRRRAWGPRNFVRSPYRRRASRTPHIPEHATRSKPTCCIAQHAQRVWLATSNDGIYLEIARHKHIFLKYGLL